MEGDQDMQCQLKECCQWDVITEINKENYVYVQMMIHFNKKQNYYAFAQFDV